MTERSRRYGPAVVLDGNPRLAKSAARFGRYVILPTEDDGCNGWSGRVDAAGYARFGDGEQFGTVFAHIIAYLLSGRDIPDGYEVDHACHSRSSCTSGNDCPHRRCTRADHLEAVPLHVNRESRRRAPVGPVCPQGHERTPENTYTNHKTGRKSCRECHRIATERWVAKGNNRNRQNDMRAARRKAGTARKPVRVETGELRNLWSRDDS